MMSFSCDLWFDLWCSLWCGTLFLLCLHTRQKNLQWHHNWPSTIPAPTYSLFLLPKIMRIPIPKSTVFAMINKVAATVLTLVQRRHQFIPHPASLTSPHISAHCSSVIYTEALNNVHGSTSYNAFPVAYLTLKKFWMFWCLAPFQWTHFPVSI